MGQITLFTTVWHHLYSPRALAAIRSGTKAVEIYSIEIEFLAGSAGYHRLTCKTAIKQLAVVGVAFSALTLLVGQQEGQAACKKTECWGVGMVICLQQGADLHTAQTMPLPLIVSCFSKIQIGSGTGSPG